MSISPSKKKYGNFKQTGWLFYALIACKLCYAQSDTTKQVKKSFENYYAPWHRTINDTAKWNVSKFGHYFSVGIGYKHSSSGGCVLLSYSLAYKSHLFTLTRGGSSDPTGELHDGDAYYNANYIGFLFGEAIRYKLAMASISAGIAYSNTISGYWEEPSWNPHFYGSGISFPIEAKVFIHAHNGIGLGIHVAKNIISDYQYSSFYFGGCIVFGYWNKHKK